MIYAVLSDIHNHAWSLFSKTNHDGVNSRLRIALDEMERAAHELKAAGGRIMFIAGDIFHTRGTIDPEVLNPLRETVAKILAMDIDIYAIPGNHDLKSNDSSMLSSAIENLSQISLDGGMFRIFNEPTVLEIEKNFFGFIPWRSNHAALLSDLRDMSAHSMAANMSVFIHAGIDGVLSGMPGYGLTDDVLSSFGFGHVFAGHYHNHVVMKNGVVSIGATTHHNWGDVGTRAGFLLVDTGSFHKVSFIDTQAPKFVDVSDLDEMDMELECKGNYVRFRGPSMTGEEIAELRKQFIDWGACGTSIEVPRTTVSARSAAPVKGRSLRDSVVAYADEPKLVVPSNVDREALKRRAVEVLEASQTVFEEA
jgi:DNA repair exonuclease SbcCD nuclease subunit